MILTLLRVFAESVNPRGQLIDGQRSIIRVIQIPSPFPQDTASRADGIVISFSTSTEGMGSAAIMRQVMSGVIALNAVEMLRHTRPGKG